MPCPRKLCVAALAATLAACYPLPPREAAAPAPPAGGPAAPARVLRIDAHRSSLRVLVYRGGPMAALGHDHVITNAALSGWIQLARPLDASRFRIEVPVAAFAVDDDAARRAAGGAFAAPVPADAKTGTRAHMLGSAQLDAAHHPVIGVRSVAITGTAPALRARVAVRVAGREAEIAVPFELARTPRELTATAAFDLRQTALGLTPYSVMLGALRVRDVVRVEIRVVAAMPGDPATAGR